VRYLNEQGKGLAAFKEGCLLNLKGVTLIAGSGMSPILLHLKCRDASLPTPIVKKYTDYHYAVSFTFMRKYYHPVILVLALAEVWDPNMFVKNPGAAATLADRDTWKNTATVPWPHGTCNAIELVGCRGGDAGAGCAAGAVGSLMKFAGGGIATDDGALQCLFLWDPWVAWTHLPSLVEAMSSASSVGRQYKLLRFTDRCDRDGRDTGRDQSRSLSSTVDSRSCFRLVTCPLGRRYLFDMGYRHVVIRPVQSGTGWTGHVMSLCCDDYGLWFLMNPDPGGRTATKLRVTGTLPGMSSVESAYAFMTRTPNLLVKASNCKYKSFDWDARKTTVVVSSPKGDSTGKFHVLPTAPTQKEGHLYYRSFYVAGALHNFAGQTLGIDVTFRLPGDAFKPGSIVTDEELFTVMARNGTYARSNGRVWGPNVEVSLEPASETECNRIWHGPCGGTTVRPDHFVVSAQLRGGLIDVATILHVTVRSTSHQYYCPHVKSHKDATRSSMGVLKQSHPKVFRVHVNTRAPGWARNADQLMTFEGDLQLKRHLPNDPPPPSQPVVAHGVSALPLSSSTANAHEGRPRKIIRSDPGTKGAEDA